MLAFSALRNTGNGSPFVVAIIWAIVQLVLLELWPFLVIFLVCILLAVPIVICEWRGRM